MTIVLKAQTSPEWIDVILSDFDAFLLDHAACERKASAMAMSLVSHYPDKPKLVQAMIDLALEEMAHFKQVMRHILAKGLMLAPDTKDPYIQALRKLVRQGSKYYLLDRLLIAGVIEARGHERFSIVGEHLEPGKLKTLYQTIAKAEEKHHQLFVKLAKQYAPCNEVDDRLEHLLDHEAQLIKHLPHPVPHH